MFCAGLLVAEPVAAQSSFPLQLELRVPQAPTAIPNGGKNYLMYELHLTNFKSSPLTIKRIEVLDPATGKISVVDGKALEEILQPVGRAPESGVTTIAPGGSVIAFMSVSQPVTRPVPAQITHRVIFGGAVAEGALVGTQNTRLHVLGPPVEGAGWYASDGPGNEPDNHHRRGIALVKIGLKNWPPGI